MHLAVNLVAVTLELTIDIRYDLYQNLFLYPRRRFVYRRSRVALVVGITRWNPCQYTSNIQRVAVLHKNNL